MTLQVQPGINRVMAISTNFMACASKLTAEYEQHYRHSNYEKTRKHAFFWKMLLMKSYFNLSQIKNPSLDVTPIT